MQIETRPLADIKPYPGNPRINADAIPAVAASIREFGFRNPILLDAEGVVIAGHTRLAAARSLGMTEAPVIVCDGLSPEQVRALRLADNQTATLSTWHEQLLFRELSGLSAGGADLSVLGFSPSELSRLLAPAPTEGQTDPDAIPPMPERPVSKPKTVYSLGCHRLVCLDGDGFNADAARKLMASFSAPADMVLANVSGYPHELALALMAANDSMVPGGVFYLWHGDGDTMRVRTACLAIDWEIRQGLVWETGQPAPGMEGDYVNCHATCAYGWKPGGAHQWFSDRKQTTALELEGVTAHPAARELPVGLLAYLIGNSCPPGGLILDPFGGDGAAVIAAERTGRRCCLAAGSLEAADVIRRRWAEFVHGPGCDWAAMTPVMGAMEDGHAN